MKKKVFILVIIGLIVCGIFVLCSSDEMKLLFHKSTESDGIKQVYAPPTLSIVVGENTYDALEGTSSWATISEDGTADAKEKTVSHPLMCQESLSLIEANSGNATLSFTVAPDTITMECWEDSCFGDVTAESVEIMLDENQFELKSGNYVYKVQASWTNEKYMGVVSYSFYVSYQ